MNFENSKTSLFIHLASNISSLLLLNLEDQINLMISDKYVVLSNFSMYCT